MSKYPYVVIRYIPGIYGNIPVRFVDPQNLYESAGSFVISCVVPFVDGNLTLEAREVVIQTVLAYSKRSNFRTCAVFGKTDCVYCDPDGSTTESDGPPRSAFQGIQFPLEG